MRIGERDAGADGSDGHRPLALRVPADERQRVERARSAQRTGVQLQDPLRWCLAVQPRPGDCVLLARRPRAAFHRRRHAETQALSAATLCGSSSGTPPHMCVAPAGQPQRLPSWIRRRRLAVVGPCARREVRTAPILFVSEDHRPFEFRITNVRIQAVKRRKLLRFTPVPGFVIKVWQYDEAASRARLILCDCLRTLAAIDEPVAERVPVDPPVRPPAGGGIHSASERLTPTLLELGRLFRRHGRERDRWRARRECALNGAASVLLSHGFLSPNGPGVQAQGPVRRPKHATTAQGRTSTPRAKRDSLLRCNSLLGGSYARMRRLSARGW
jgi:hypothetical protein